ncbi:fimbrial protein [Enterobacter mori]|uniref:fimbrial protein n=1 Tax=Enterobacter mori TaxID=539813 RepID=UPI001B8B50C3|nr:fimbrial protein [Enterobacter mori]MBS3046394.1 fimbrial protein [Enterobacter mori]
MKKKLAISVLAIAMSLPTAMVAAASVGTVTFNGNINSNTCAVAINNGTADATVTLPTVSSSVLGSAGQTAGSTNFTMDLTGCSTGTGAATAVRAYFESGANVNASTGNLKNSTATGSASNVEVQLLDSAGTVLKAGDNSQRSNPATALTSGAATLVYSAQYYATGAATAGTVNTSVTYSIDYL